jgi:sulfur carrier protein ThiS adenylyltransferase
VSSEIHISLNEQQRSVSAGTTVGELRDLIKPDADILIVNGFPSSPGTMLEEGDRAVLIQRGETPKKADLEALMVARHTPGVHRRMKAGIIGIAGLGGLGSAAVIALARIGVGTLVLADFDVVEPSNLNRQHYLIKHIGMPKTEAMKRILGEINPYIHTRTHHGLLTPENIPRVFKDCHVILECLDLAEAKAMIIEAVTQALPEAFIIGASGVAGYGDSDTIQTRRLGDRVFIVGDLVTAAEPGRGLMAPRVGIAAHHQANLAVSLLMGDRVPS